MKQRVAIEQLNELSDEQKERLREWWQPQVGDWYADWNMYAKKYSESLYFVVEEDTYYNSEPDKANTDLPLLSIGQMTQMFNDNANDWGIHFNDSGVFFTVYLSWNMETARMSGKLYSSDELVDALWEAVKRVL